MTTSKEEDREAKRKGEGEAAVKIGKYGADDDDYGDTRGRTDNAALGKGALSSAGMFR